MKEAIAAYLAEPTPEAYREVRERLLASPGYVPDSLAVHRLWADVEAGRLNDAWEQADSVRANYLLSPLAHSALAALAEKSGNAEVARFEQALGLRSRGSLLASGDGSLTHPYEVNRVDDEYSILAALRAKVQKVGAVLAGDRFLDVLYTDQGPLHFHVGRAFEAYGRG